MEQPKSNQVVEGTRFDSDDAEFFDAVPSFSTELTRTAETFSPKHKDSTNSENLSGHLSESSPIQPGMTSEVSQSDRGSTPATNLTPIELSASSSKLIQPGNLSTEVETSIQSSLSVLNKDSTKQEAYLVRVPDVLSARVSNSTLETFLTETAKPTKPVDSSTVVSDLTRTIPSSTFSPVVNTHSAQSRTLSTNSTQFHTSSSADPIYSHDLPTAPVPPDSSCPSSVAEPSVLHVITNANQTESSCKKPPTLKETDSITTAATADSGQGWLLISKFCPLRKNFFQKRSRYFLSHLFPSCLFE